MAVQRVVVVVQRVGVGVSLSLSSSVVGIDGAGDGGSSRDGAGVWVGWAAVEAAVWRVSMAKEDRMRVALSGGRRGSGLCGWRQC